MQPPDVEQVRAALRALVLEPHPANFDRACALIEALPARRRPVPIGIVPAEVLRTVPARPGELGRN